MMSRLFQVTVSGERAEEVGYETVADGALGTYVDDANGVVVISFQGTALLELVRQRAEEYGCECGGTEELDPDTDYLALSQIPWHPIVLDGLTIVPSFEDSSTEEFSNEQPLLHIRPGGGFGTGHHPTTKMLLRHLLSWLKVRSQEPSDSSLHVWDIGAGSGILALSCLRVCPNSTLLAWEFDPLAAENARMNMELNDLSYTFIELPFDQDQFSQHRETSPDLVVANLYSSLHGTFSDLYREALSPGGMLMLSGIMASELIDFDCSFRRDGATWSRVFLSQNGEWGAVGYRRKG
jgi:ribosomal protein L11 methylase PrmA